MRSSARPWLVVAGGGTGGHLYPGLAVARELVSRGCPPSAVHFVGARRGLEARTRALEGFPATFLPGRGLRRSLSADAWAANLGALAGTALAVGEALALFARWRPAVVMALGGYASLPCVLAAVLWRCPLVVVNVDAVTGAVNRLAARLARATAVGAPGVAVPRAVHTGVPVRSSMADLDRSPEGRRRARLRLDLPERGRVVVVSGGSLGARRINQATLELAAAWSDRADVALRHVVGRRDWPWVSAARPAPGAMCYQQVEYEEDMASLYAAADVAVQRAGANTVAELALAGVPSLLVPLPGAPGDHQGANARTVAGAGGAVVVNDDELDGGRLASELEALLGAPARLEEMGRAAKGLGRPGATSEVADLVQRHARRPMPREGR